MPVTLNVNGLSAVHAGSSGISSAFPDVCKTPTPAGPVPIPYPNVAQSSDTADATSTVKVDGNPIMVKNSNFSQSTGDEAGSAMNVVSSKTKGQANPMLYSMDVKADGKNVFRLSDMMLQNCGGGGNPPGTPPASEVQAPLPPGFLAKEECKDVKESKDKQGKEIASEKSGMYDEHFNAIEKVAKEFKVVFYFRQTNPLCIKWIKKLHQPKPHEVFKANTIKPGDHVTEVQNWLNTYQKKRMTQLQLDDGLSEAAAKVALAKEINGHAPLLTSNAAYHTNANEFVGVVGEPVIKGVSRKPVKYVMVPDMGSHNDYSDKWITGDYDLFQILYAVPGCKEVDQHKAGFEQIQTEVNYKCGWDAIQHGPQAQWVPNDKEKKAGAPNVSFPAKLKAALKNSTPDEKVVVNGRSTMNVVDEKVTVISPSGVLFLEKSKDTMKALQCRECDKD